MAVLIITGICRIGYCIYYTNMPFPAFIEKKTVTKNLLRSFAAVCGNDIQFYFFCLSVTSEKASRPVPECLSFLPVPVIPS